MHLRHRLSVADGLLQAFERGADVQLEKRQHRQQSQPVLPVPERADEFELHEDQPDRWLNPTHLLGVGFSRRNGLLTQKPIGHLRSLRIGSGTHAEELEPDSPQVALDDQRTPEGQHEQRKEKTGAQSRKAHQEHRGEDQGSSE